MNGMIALAQRGALVSGIRAQRTNAEIEEFHNIPISTVKKISKLYNDFLASGGKDEDFDIQRRSTSNTATPRGRAWWRPSTSGRRKFGLLVAQISITWTFMYGARLRGTLIGPLITPRTPSLHQSWRCSAISPGWTYPRLPPGQEPPGRGYCS